MWPCRCLGRSPHSPSHGPERAREWDREPPTPKASRAHSKHHSCSRKVGSILDPPWGGLPHDSSSSWGRKLPTPPRPLRKEMSKRAGSPVHSLHWMLWEVTQSPPLSWEKNGCERRKTSKRGTPLLEEIPSPVHPLHVWRAVASVTFRWLKKAASAR